MNKNGQMRGMELRGETRNKGERKGKKNKKESGIIEIDDRHCDLCKDRKT